MPPRRTLLTLLALFLVLTPVVALASAAPEPGYIALGDSIDFGIGSSTGAGWVVPFHAFLQAAVAPSIELHNLAVPGAETQDIDQDQLPVARSEAARHAPYGVVVSLGGGGNDLRHFIESPAAHACLEVPSCFGRLNGLLNEIEQHVDRALKQLREAAPDATILVRTQYNPLRRTGCDPDGQADLGDAALEAPPGTVFDRGGLNYRLRAAAARQGAKVIEIFGPFWVAADALVSTDCIHPNDAGYDVIFGIAVSTFTAP